MDTRCVTSWLLQFANHFMRCGGLPVTHSYLVMKYVLRQTFEKENSCCSAYEIWKGCDAPIFSSELHTEDEVADCWELRLISVISCRLARQACYICKYVSPFYCNEHDPIQAISNYFGNQMTTQSMRLTNLQDHICRNFQVSWMMSKPYLKRPIHR